MATDTIEQEDVTYEEPSDVSVGTDTIEPEPSAPAPENAPNPWDVAESRRKAKVNPWDVAEQRRSSAKAQAEPVIIPRSENLTASLTPLTSAAVSKTFATQKDLSVQETEIRPSSMPPRFEPDLSKVPTEAQKQGYKSFQEENLDVDTPIIRLGDMLIKEPGQAQSKVEEGINEALRPALNGLTTQRNLAYMLASAGVASTGVAARTLVSGIWAAVMGKDAVESAPRIYGELGEEMAKPEGERDKQKIARLMAEGGLGATLAVLPAIHVGTEVGKSLGTEATLTPTIKPVIPPEFTEAAKAEVQNPFDIAAQHLEHNNAPLTAQAIIEVGKATTETEPKVPVVEPPPIPVAAPVVEPATFTPEQLQNIKERIAKGEPVTESEGKAWIDYSQAQPKPGNIPATEVKPETETKGEINASGIEEKIASTEEDTLKLANAARESNKLQKGTQARPESNRSSEQVARFESASTAWLESLARGDTKASLDAEAKLLGEEVEAPQSEHNILENPDIAGSEVRTSSGHGEDIGTEPQQEGARASQESQRTGQQTGEPRSDAAREAYIRAPRTSSGKVGQALRQLQNVSDPKEAALGARALLDVLSKKKISSEARREIHNQIKDIVYARRQSISTEVHGDLRTQPVEGEGQVPVNEGGEGVRPSTELQEPATTEGEGPPVAPAQEGEVSPNAGARKGTVEGLARVEEARQRLRDVINNPDIVGKQRADMIANHKQLIGFLEANADTTKPIETDVFKGDQIAYTGVDTPDGREFIYLEGHKAGDYGVSPNKPTTPKPERTYDDLVAEAKTYTAQGKFPPQELLAQIEALKNKTGGMPPKAKPVQERPGIIQMRAKLFGDIGPNLNDWIKSATREQIVEKYKLSNDLFKEIDSEIAERKKLKEDEKALFPLRYDVDGIRGSLEHWLMTNTPKPESPFDVAEKRLKEKTAAKETPQVNDEVTWTTGAGDRARSTVSRIDKLPNDTEPMATVDWFGDKRVPVSKLEIVKKSSRRIAEEERAAKAAQPQVAAKKIEQQIKRTAIESGQRPAKEVKSELVSRIEKAIADAPNAADVEEKRATKVSGESYVSQESTKTKITIDIPGDGEFTVDNTKEALTELLDRAKKVSTTKGTAPSIKTPKSKPSDPETLDRLIDAYGSAEGAAKRMRSQAEAVGEDYTIDQKYNAERFAQALEERARLAKNPKNQRTNRFEELSRLRRDLESAETDIEHFGSKAKEITADELKESQFSRSEKKRYQDTVKNRTKKAEELRKEISDMGENVYEPQIIEEKVQEISKQIDEQKTAIKIAEEGIRVSPDQQYEGRKYQAQIDKANKSIASLEAQRERLTSQIKPESLKTETPPEPSKIVGMGGAIPEEFSPAGGGPTAMRYRQIDQERQQRGLPPLTKGETVADQVVWDRAKAEFDKDPAVADKLVEDILTKPRVVSDLENHVLLLHKIALRDAYEKSAREAIQAYEDSTANPLRRDDMLEANLRTAAWSDKLDAVERASRLSGSERGRALRSLRVMANEDFSLASLEMQKRAARGGAPITDTERAELAKVAEEYKVKADNLQKYLDERDAKIAQMESQAALDKVAKEAAKQPEIHPKILQIAESFVKKLDSRADAARERIKERLKRTNIAVDPTVLVDLAEIGASHLAHKVLDFAKWSEKMISDVGEWVKPHLEQVYAASQKNIDQIAESHPEKSKISAIKKVLTEPDVEQFKEAIVDKIKEKAKQGKKDEITYYVQRLARVLYQNGIRGRDAMVDALHGIISKAIPDISRREVMDAFSGYGDYKQLSKDQISVGIRDLKGQLQQVGKLQDMEAKKAPARTGREQRTPSDEERRLRKQVEEMKRRGGYVVTDPATQLRTALQSLKTRLTNEISDLDYQIKSGQKIVRGKTTVIPDAEAIKLKAQRDALKEEFDKVFPKQGITDEQRVQNAIKATEKSLAEYERKIKEGDLGPITKPSKTPSTPELEAIRAKRDAAREQLQELRDLADPKKTPEEIALQTFKTRTANRMVELAEKLANEDYTIKPRREVVLDEEATRLKAEKDRLAKQFKRELALERMKNRTKTERVGDALVRWYRGFILSGPVTLAKLTSAAVQRMTFTPLEEAVGAGIGKIIPKIAAKAPREGGFNSRAEAQAIVKGITTGMKDAWKTLKTGQSDLDVLYGKEALLPPAAIDFFGHVHGALKAPTKRAEFTRSLEKRTQAAISEGVDVRDPLVQSKLIIESYKDANKAIFQQDNRVVTGWKNLLRGLEQPDKVTGEVPLHGKVLATGGRILMPIVKIPTNIVAETIQYATGSGTGLLRAIRAIYRGTENLKPEEADLIMRSLKKGSIGAAVFFVGYFNADKVGGYYQPGEKRKSDDAKVGRIKIGDVQIPSFLLHNPLLETLQIGATVRRVAESKLHKKDKDEQGIPAGILASSLGLLDEVPFVKEVPLLAKGLDPRQQTQFWGELAKSMIVPQAVQYWAKKADENDQGETIKRDPKTLMEHIKTGIPYLREDVKKKKKQ